MARLSVEGENVRVRLNLLERIAAWRWDVRAPLAAVTEVTVLEKTGWEVVAGLVTLGFAGAGAPAGGIVTVGPRARTRRGDRAFVVSYLSGPGVLVQLDPSRSTWGLLLVTGKNVQETAARLRAAVIARGDGGPLAQGRGTRPGR
jgi:hypothetical protein